MKKTKHPWLFTLFLLFLIFAIVHALTLLAYSVLHGSTEKLNLFSIIGLDLFFPSVASMSNSFAVSLIAFVLLYTAVYFYSSGKRKTA